MNTPIAACMLKNVRVQSPHLFEPYTDKYGKTRYSAIFRIYDEPNKKLVLDAMKEAVRAACPTDWERRFARIRANPNCCLLREPEDADDYSFLKATRLYDPQRRGADRPLLMRSDTSPAQQEDGELVSGAYVNAKLTFRYYNNQSEGVIATIEAVQFVKEGESFGSRPMASVDEFEDLSNKGESSDNPFAV